MLKLINNLSIRSKLLTLAILPLIGFICFASESFITTYQDKVSLEKMLVLTDSASASSFLVHELQKERGASAGYLSSKGKKFKDILAKQRLMTDEKRQALQDFIQSAPLTPHLTSIFSDINKELNKLNDVRQQVDTFSITTAKEVAFYTALNAQLLSIIDMMANDSTDPELSISAVTIGSFLQHKERAGIERAVMSNVFSVDSFSSSFLKKFISLLAEQQVYLAKFKAHATPEQLSIYSSNMSESALKPVQEFRDIALKNMLKGGFNVDSTVWFKTITEKINKLKAVENSLINELHQKNTVLISQRESALTSHTIIILLPLIIVLFLCWYITSQLHKGINEITNKLINITTSDNLTLRIEVDSNDELGKISLTINQLVAHLQDLVGKIQHTTATLKTNLTENIESNHRIGGNISTGSDQVSQVVTATTEMSSTVSEIARNAMQAASETEKANNETQNGNHEVEETIENINHLSTELDNASNVIEKLNGSALNIGTFLNVIKEISEKTNLLALNAAIEAARAGESGRGFAVVADEVRSLALQTKKSTSEIEAMITELQTSSTEAQQAMSNGIEMVDKSVNDARRTGKDIAHITDCIEQINQMNEQVATAAEEQSSVTEEINRNMVNIQEGYSEMQLSYEKIDKCSQSVELLTNELNETVKQFKI